MVAAGCRGLLGRVPVLWRLPRVGGWAELRRLRRVPRPGLAVFVFDGEYRLLRLMASGSPGGWVAAFGLGEGPRAASMDERLADRAAGRKGSPRSTTRAASIRIWFVRPRRLIGTGVLVRSALRPLMSPGALRLAGLIDRDGSGSPSGVRLTPGRTGAAPGRRGAVAVTCPRIGCSPRRPGREVATTAASVSRGRPGRKVPLPRRPPRMVRAVRSTGSTLQQGC